MSRLLLALLAAYLWASGDVTDAAVAAAQPAMSAPPGDLVVTTLEDDAPAAIQPANLTITESADAAAEGRSYVQLMPSKPEANVARLRLPLPPRTSPAGRARLTAAVRAPAAAGKVELRWFALDETNRPIFQRRFELAPGEKWVRLDEPLRNWRWDNRRVGDWDEVTSVVLVVASPNVKRIDLDDVRFTGTTDEKRQAEWLLDLA